jgi:hypothetical protein
MNVVEVRMHSSERIANPDDLTIHALVENWHTRDSHLTARLVIISESTESLTEDGLSRDIERSLDRFNAAYVLQGPL